VNGMMQTLRSLGGTRVAIMGGITAALIAFFVFVVGRMTTAPMTLLFGELDLQESAQIVGKLETMKVPFELRANGTQILVPDDQVLRLRLTMAQDGLPSGGSIGYEIFDRTESLGTTNFVQNINHLRALEGEIARTIRSIDGVANARVHLVLPKREIFSRENREPTASIVLKMRGSRRLDKSQVIAIENLVAAAVPDLKPSRISIVDERGTLLASAAKGSDANAGTASNLTEMKANLEDRLKQSVETLLERSVGVGNVRAEVTADIDFDRVTTNQELFDPDGQVVRSTQSVAENGNSTEQDGGQVSVANNLPEAKGNQASNKSNNTNARTEETVNYEISKTVRTQTREAGLVRRLSVAVLVNGTQTAKPDGTKAYTPRTPEDLKQLTALAKSAVGFDAKRGDTVEVVNLPFTGAEELPALPQELTVFGLGKVDLFRVAEMLVLGVVALLVILLVVRPLLARALAIRPPEPRPQDELQQLTAQAPANGLPPPDAIANALAHMPPGEARTNLEAMIDIARVEGQVKASSLKKIGEIVEKHPEEAVAIMRTWLYQDA